MSRNCCSYSIAAATVNLPYDPVADFTPVALLVSTWNLIAVNKNVPAQTLPEYFEHARKKGFSQYASGNVGSTTTHLLVELMRICEKAPLQHIPTSNVATAFSDLLAGNVDMMCYPALAIQPHIQSGGARALAVASGQRVPLFAEVPTVLEALKSNEYDLQSWFGLFAPAKTPASIVSKSLQLSQMLRRACVRTCKNLALKQSVGVQSNLTRSSGRSCRSGARLFVSPERAW